MEDERPQNSSSWRKVLVSCLPDLHLTPATTLTMLLSLAISGPALMRQFRGESVWSKLDLGGEVLEKMAGHRLITYIYFTEDLPTMVCSILLIWYFGGGFEENIGTVKFCFLTPLFAVSAGALYLGVIATGFNPQADVSVQGFTVVAFSMISVFTLRTSLRRLIFCGFIVPMKIMPVLFLIFALLLPHATVLSNVCGTLVGAMYGLGGCFFLDPSESLLSRIDQMLPFRVLKNIPLWRYIPATLAERNASQTKKLNPPPGSYPTQQYYTPPEGLQDKYSPYHHARVPGTWPPAGVSVYPAAAASGVYHQNSDCSGHLHSHTDNVASVDFESTSQKDAGTPASQTELLQVETR
ncbi:PREDICTED: rhomboid domain-containing protein 2 [Nanorana parkeri]|uniref:rhomboid domain-containing protein 2 n=1 Tax=Nanorana parkeri TaxID=125878 RepID=UPI0008544594|nr:PREDICTED: rhomboid domain-containing protein 2 [Nanorana parkeri]